MNKHEYALLMGLSMMFGLIGGVAACCLVMGNYAVAGIITAVGDTEALPQTQFPRDKRLRLERLELVDKTGKTRAALALNEKDKPGLMFFDKKGSLSLSLRLTEEGNPALMMQGRDGSKIALVTGENNKSYLVFESKKGKTQARLMVDQRANSSLYLYDKDAKSNVGLCAFAKGKPGVALSNRRGRVCALFRLSPTDAPYLSLLDKNYKTRAVLGEITADLGMGFSTPSPSSLVLFDEQEKPVWRAP